MKTARLTNGQEFAIGKVVCIARNYVDHIRELGNQTPEAPVVFMKPSTAVIGDGEKIVIPAYSSECHHEAELAVLIGRTARNVAAADALTYVAGYGVALDLTLRDVQGELKKKGLPWEMAKAFDTSCPLSTFTEAAKVPNPQDLQIRLTVNGELRQDGSTAMMIHPVAAMISHMSTLFTLEPGDVILTGTPAGVSPIVSGDRLEADIPGVATLRVTVV